MLMPIVANLGVTSLCFCCCSGSTDGGAAAFSIETLRHRTKWRADALASCPGALLAKGITLPPIHLQALDSASAAKHLLPNQTDDDLH